MSDFNHNPLEKIVKPRIYIAGPYTAKEPYQQNNNIEIAKQVGMKFMRAGIDVYIPHMATANLDFVAGYNYFMDLHLTFLKDWATDIIMIDGWEKSKGSVIEFNKADQWGKKIWYERQVDTAIYHYLNGGK